MVRLVVLPSRSSVLGGRVADRGGAAWGTRMLAGVRLPGDRGHLIRKRFIGVAGRLEAPDLPLACRAAVARSLVRLCGGEEARRVPAGVVSQV
jgi:hypothetical protein